MSRLRAVFIGSLLFCIHSLSLSAQCRGGRWVTLAAMIAPRQEVAVAEAGGKLFVLGGLSGRANANEIYDTQTDTWSSGADLPIANDHAWSVTLAGRVYVGGGRSPQVFSYDPEMDAWTEVASSIYQHGGTPAAAVIDELIYVAGGSGGGMVGNELEVYDPAADEWTELPPMTYARNHTTGGAINGKLYVAGGRPGNQDFLEEYDPATETWTTKTAMPTGRSGVAGAVVGNCLYVFGGEGNAGDPAGIFHQVEAYDAATDRWTDLGLMQTGRHGIYAAVIGNVVYLPGGATRQGLGATDVNEAYVIDPPRPPSLVFEQVVTDLERPVAITHARDGSGRLFITLQRGRIAIFDGQELLPTPFLDIRHLVYPIGGIGDERGLLSVAFHPDYASNGYFFVNYVNTSNNTVIARYTVSADDPNRADPDSAVLILEIAQPPFPNHKGGQLQFGPDGYLYIGTGDGGSAGDPGNRAQNLGELLGKMLRIDINGGEPYAIPPDNPFLEVPGAQPEIWAYGLRNPWRFSFDRASGDLFIGDVGQNRREEVDHQSGGSPGGQNYGWRLMEGSLCFNPPSDCDDGTLTLPILEYPRASGCAVTGGYVYRGERIPALQGFYLYGDYCSGRIWRGIRNEDGTWSDEELNGTPYAISTFGEDEAGEIYLAHLSLTAGTIYRIVGFE